MLFPLRQEGRSGAGSRPYGGMEASIRVRIRKNFFDSCMKKFADDQYILIKQLTKEMRIYGNPLEKSS